MDESIFPGRGAGDLEIESLKGAARPLDESPCRDVAESRLDEAVEVHIIHDETAVTRRPSSHDKGVLRRGENDDIAERIAPFIEKEEIETDAIGDEDVAVARLRRSRIADAGGVADTDETIDAVLAGSVRADAVVAALDRPDVFKNHLAAVAMDIEAVIVGMRCGEVANDEVGIFAAELHSSAAHRHGDVCLGEGLTRSEAKVKDSLDGNTVILGRRRSLNEGPFARREFIGCLERGALPFRNAPHSLHLPVEKEKPAGQHGSVERGHQPRAGVGPGRNLRPLRRVEWIRSLERRAVSIESNGFAGLAFLPVKARVVVVDLARLKMDRVAGRGEFDGMVNRGHLGIDADAEVAGVEGGSRHKHGGCEEKNPCCGYPPDIPWTMITKLQSWGNSQGVRLPKSLLGRLQLETGTSVEVELSPKGDAIILRPIRNAAPIRGRHRIEDLAAAMPKDYATVETPWGSEGGEVW